MNHAFKQTEIKLKNNTLVTIREAEISDAPRLLGAIKKYIPESDFIPKLGSEIKLTIAQEEGWIQSFLEKDNSLLLVAEYDNELIGNIDLTGNSRIVMAHTAVIGMGILADWRGIGLGTALLQSIILWAKENPLLELIWLQVYTANAAGMNLYKKAGFIENGIIKNFFKNGNTYYDNLTMSMKVG